MTLVHPIWLFLFIPAAASLWYWRPRSRWVVGLRIVTFTLVILAMCRLAILFPSRAGTIVVIVDRSNSMPEKSQEKQHQLIDLIQADMKPADQLAVVSFGRNVVVERQPSAGKFAGFVHTVEGDGSQLAEAMQAALALIPKDHPGRIVVVADGHYTGSNPAPVATQAAARGIAVDYHVLQRPAAADVAVARLDVPSAVGPAESFLINSWIWSPVAQTVDIELRRNGVRLSAGKRPVAAGLTRVTFRDQAADPSLHPNGKGQGEGSTHVYELNVAGPGNDPVLQNNHARFMVGVQGPKSLLLVTPAKSSGLADLLRAGGIDVTVTSPEERRWTIEELSRHSGVLLENVPAHSIGGVGMENLAAWVRETGAGLMMTGGRNSYGPGGYFKSPLDPLLPVSMELRQEHRKLSLAIVVALDRSGSMAVPVGGGRNKMDLANIGTAQVLDLLNSSDEFGVLAVDSAPHVVQNLGRVTDKESVRSKILRIESMGGGIFVYEALETAHLMMKAATAGTRHIILFADAADAEEPKAYRELLKRCNAENITVSVIGLGKSTDSDGALLEDIARRGKGRCFFTESPTDLPRLFAQDTIVVARSSFLDQATPLSLTAGLRLLSTREFTKPPALGGYNLCYLRPGANLAGVTVDEYRAPVVATWQAGAGRVACFTGEADGQYSGSFARWDDVGHFFTSLARWTAGSVNELPNHMLLTQEIAKDNAVVKLHLDPERLQEPFAGLPKANVLRGVAGEKPRVEKASLRWESADTLAIDIPLGSSETVLTSIEVPGHRPITLAPVCLPYSAEYRPNEPAQGLTTMKGLARATGGQERVGMANIWASLPEQDRFQDLTSWLLLAAIVMLLLEVLQMRTQLVSSGFTRLARIGNRLRRRAPASAEKAVVKRIVPRTFAAAKESPGGETTKTVETAKPDATPPVAAPGLLDALKQVNKRKR